MGSFEMDGDAEDPFADAPADDASTEAESMGDEAEATTDAAPAAADEPTGEGTTGGGNSTQPASEAAPAADQDPDTGRTTGTDTVEQTSRDTRHTPDDLVALTSQQSVAPTAVARALASDAYASERPPVPYALWRDSVEEERAKTTINFNTEKLNPLAEEVQRQFKAQYDTNIPLTDLRELAMAYGLLHSDSLFKMAEEWGIQYDS